MTRIVQPKGKRHPVAAKSLVIALTTLTVAAVTFVWLLQQPRLRAAGQAQQPSPVLSVAQAQRQVPFPLYVPRDLPTDGVLTGVRVYEITLKNPELVRATIAANTKPITGYGLVWRYENDNIMVHSLPGSPADKAGLGSQQAAVRLLSVNGYSVQPAEDARHEREFFARWETMTDQERRAAQKNHPPLTLRLMARPLHLTVQDADGATRRITLARPETFTFRPEAPNAENAGKRAALLLEIAGRSVPLVQTPAKQKPALPEKARCVQVDGKVVWLSGPQNAPSAFWREPGVDMALHNPGVLSLEEVCRLVKSTEAFKQ